MKDRLWIRLVIGVLLASIVIVAGCQSGAEIARMESAQAFSESAQTREARTESKLAAAQRASIKTDSLLNRTNSSGSMPSVMSSEAADYRVENSIQAKIHEAQETSKPAQEPSASAEAMPGQGNAPAPDESTAPKESPAPEAAPAPVESEMPELSLPLAAASPSPAPTESTQAADQITEDRESSPAEATRETQSFETLQIGVKGENVSHLQAKLVDLGYLDMDRPGYFGNSTRDAVKEFQRQNSLVADGVVGDSTWTVLILGNPKTAE